MLAQNMNSTMDKIVRNMLNATASSHAAFNGVNGKMSAVVKSLMIDLEAYVMQEAA